MTRKTPVRHIVRHYIRKRRNGKSYSQVHSHARGSGLPSPKKIKGTSAYLSQSPSAVLRAGYGVGAGVELIAPQPNRFGGLIDPKFSHRVGSTGTITRHFGSDPVVQWDGEKPISGSGGQVVPANVLKVIGKASRKKKIIAIGGYDKIRKFAADYAYGFYEKGNKVTVNKIEPVMDDAGFIVGDVEYQLIGTKHGDHIDFDTPKLVQSSVPRSLRSVYREYFESTDPKDHFGGMFE